jgi:hypothetical protein
VKQFPADAPKGRVLRAPERLGFHLVREREHIAMGRDNPDDSRTPLTMPNHPGIKGSTPRAIFIPAGIACNDFLHGHEEG